MSAHWNVGSTEGYILLVSTGTTYTVGIDYGLTNSTFTPGWGNWPADRWSAVRAYSAVPPPKNWRWFDAFRQAPEPVLVLQAPGRGLARARFYRGLRDAGQRQREKRRSWIQKARAMN